MNREYPHQTMPPVQHSYGNAPQQPAYAPQQASYIPEHASYPPQQASYAPQEVPGNYPQQATYENPTKDPSLELQDPPPVAAPQRAETKSEAAMKQTGNFFDRIHGAGEYIRQSFNSVIDRAAGDTVNADRQQEEANRGYNRMMAGKRTRPIERGATGARSEQLMDAPADPNVASSPAVYPNTANTAHAGMGGVPSGRV